LAATHVPDCLLSAAHWRAAHDGLDDRLVDPRVGEHRGELDIVMAELSTLRPRGNGATRQRALSGRDIPAMLDAFAHHALEPWPSGG
jgi:carboxylate-amine ligase